MRRGDGPFNDKLRKKKTVAPKKLPVASSLTIAPVAIAPVAVPPPMATAVLVGNAEPDIDLASAGGAAYAAAEPDINLSGTKKGDESSSNRSRRHSEVLMDDYRHFSERQINSLIGLGYTRGLARSTEAMENTFAKRIWIVDNSGSMNRADGSLVVENERLKTTKLVGCTRWDEIVDCINYHIELAGTIRTPTTFVFLNPPDNAPQRFDVATPEVTVSDYDNGVKEAKDIMRRVQPRGTTPLSAHINMLRQEIASMAGALRQSGKQVALIIATDGLPSDARGYSHAQSKHEFVDSLKSLEGLPVWLVVRLCTNEDDVVDFYNDLDNQLEFSIDVLDDFVGEAKETKDTNPWLNYGLTMHRMREMGYHDRIFDMLDERKLTKSELRGFCEILFSDAHFDGMPDPVVDWDEFVKYVDKLLRKEEPQWDATKMKMKPWINLKKLEKIYGDGCTIM